MTGTQDISFKAGEIVMERYRVVAQLGSGGMGTVYRVEHTLMAKEMAMKLLRPELSVIPQIVERFEREARSASRLDNEHIVRVTDFGRAPNGALYLVMELLEGESLTDRMKIAMSPSEAIDIADQVLAALEHAHSNGVVHRDLKPDNMMMVRRDGRVIVKILDFGLAKLTSDTVPEGPTLTQAGMVFGTPRYMAPEQAAAEPVDERTDLYAVGVLLYEMLSGRPPFVQPNAVDLLTAHLTQPVPPLEVPSLPPEIGAKLQAVIHKAMSKHRKDRYENASAFRAAIAEVRMMLPESAYAPTGVAIPRGVSSGKIIGGDANLADTVMKRGVSTVHPVPQERSRAVYALAAIVLVLLGAGALKFLGSATVETSAHEKAEKALADGDLSAARAILGQLIAKDAKNARTEVLLGHVNVAEGDWASAAEAYKAALELDGSATKDPVMVANARRMVDKDQKAAGVLVTALALHADNSAAELFAELAQNAPTQRMRNHSYQALERLKETSRIDLPAYLGDELEKISAKSCKQRKWYVDRLAQIDDPRVLPLLKRERGRKGGLFNLEEVNGCMTDDLKNYISRYEKN